MRRFLIVLTLSLLPATAGAQSLTVRDVVELTKAGLGDEALLALIDVHRPIFPVDIVTLKGLKDAGVAPAVIVAMIKSGRTDPPPPLPLSQPLELPAPASAPAQVVVIEHHDEPTVREVAVPVPVYVAVGRSRRYFDDDRDLSSRHPVHRPAKPAEPVYWGWGGKLRPDAWKPTAADVQKDAKVPREPQRR
ncbi:MAG: hypothetical protein H0W08_25295 [Acidobacteria bacterium]|nr:hypothetical protein [Acidobacteriota bacterium]